MADRLFRFGVVASDAADGAGWTAQARRAEELGYATFLTPDTLRTLAPLPALAAAAAATTSIHVGTFVLAAPFRRAEQVAWEVDALNLLSGGRFELGIGAGRPDGRQDADRLGVPFGSVDQRIGRIQEVIGRVRRWPGARPAPRVLIAGRSARMLGLAARTADSIALGLPADTPEDGLAGPVRLIRQAADDFDRLEIAVSVHLVGEDEPPPWLARRLGGPLPDDAVTVLRGTPRQMADRLLRRRDAHQVSYITVTQMYAERLAPVVELLAGS
ncbi:N5,N10-methylene tetrahydromethanopterin reductase [Sphaerisporangium rufum]|uniref:N5,N10-methylene tetrahydromethanopterin reductase n=1 Tax=Sphaerisporangium rufum TaxID=1381558 RepID=A0A919R8V5_9ACTN|nr:LLM class flavin-dependent oxidoreductase [Sphaerisporangium rufum]GII81353.1 N5,N10-methylene tetrahydromethanopterin reductase [Sphaerisporangium rufum]